LQIILHLDVYLLTLISACGVWIYALLFLIILLESGFVLTPFLPGESLLFALGAVSAQGALSVHVLAGLLILAAILGGFVNFYLGWYLGEWLFPQQKSSVFHRYLVQTQAFYQRHGGKTILIARLIPIVRTYAPFVAGMAKMRSRYFMVFNCVGAILWITVFLYSSFYFGNLPLVKQHFSWFIWGIVIISLLPSVVGILRQIILNNKYEKTSHS
jgi:membrane-associated protein